MIGKTGRALTVVAMLGFTLFAPATSRAQQPATPAPAASAAPVASVAPAATAAPAATSKPNDADDLLAPTPAATGAPAASSNDDLLAPSTPGAKPATSSQDDLLLPQGEKGTNQPMPDELLLVPNAPQNPPPKPAGAGTALNAAAAHAQLLVENKFPSASTCATCHPTQFRQWSVSQHAYAQISPVFNTMQATIDKRTSGTNGDFCIRCHTQVGMQLEEPIFASNMDRNPTSREGITCIVCHRVKKNYGKVSGRTSIAEGDLFEPVYGPKGDKILKSVLSQPDKYQVVTKRGEVGRAIHTDVIKFDPLEKSGFCGTCHDVNLLNGFRLEEAFSQFKNSPANKRGETCQDCHMGKIPGIKSGYAFGPAAMVGDQATPPRKLTDHRFAGPDYSVIHPGLFPFNVKAQQLATMREWLQFDYHAGWGTDAFENHAPKDYKFPPRWQSIDDRYDARAILDDQFAKLEEANMQRYQILRRGFQLHDFVIEENDARGIKFKVQVVNGTDGHGTPTGFDAERANFLQVRVTDRRGKVIFVSGDRDPNGDVRDEESAYVHNRKLPIDKYLFSLQSKFLVQLIRGGERVQVLPTNKSVDPLPYVRPATNADALLARPNGARKQSIVLPPGGDRWASYKVDGSRLTGQTPYTVNVKFIAQMIPVNLIADIAEVGIDYNMSPKAVADRVIERSQTLWNKTVVLPAHPAVISLKPTERQIMAPPTKPFMPESKGGLQTTKVVETNDLSAH
ncbi:MAG: multiheme c-type cytochrome [Chthoniobacterales bacterium]